MSIIMNFLIIIFEAACGTAFFTVMMPRKNAIRNRAMGYLAETAILAALFLLLSNFIEIWLIQKAVMTLSCAFVACLFHKANLITRIAISVIYHMKLFIYDYFALIVICNCLSVSSEELMATPSLFFLTAMISKFLFAIVILVWKKIKNDRCHSFEYLSGHFWIIFVIQSLISALALSSIVGLNHYINKFPSIAVVSAAGLLILNTVVVLSIESIARLTKDSRENALIKQQVEIELDNIKTLVQTFNAQRQFMHEYKNQINTLYHLMNAGNYQQALNFIKPLTEQIYYALYRIKTDHDIIDAILNQKDIQARENGIEIDVRAADLSMIAIPDNLLVIIIGNVLDNAIEACMNMEAGKTISVKLVEENGILIFSVINPVNAPVVIINNSIRTTKEDKTIHGIGLKNVAMALSQCNGDYELYCDGHFFQFTAFIRLQDNN